MEFLANALEQSLKGTLTIPEPIPPVTSTHHGKHGGHHHTGVPTHSGPSYSYEHIGETGHRALTVITVLFGVATVLAFLMSKRVERKLRLFHNVTMVILATAFVSYLCMTFDMGKAYVPSYKHGGGHHVPGGVHVHDLREVFYARYIDWAITTPLLLLDLALLAGLPLTTTILVMIADEMMIITGLIAGLSRSTEAARWIFFAVSDVFFLYVLYTLIFSGRNAAKLQSDNVQRVFNVTMIMTVILWTGYPIVFALTEGKGRISPDAEVIVYGVLDVFAKIVFGMYLLVAHSHTEGDSVVISEFWTEPRGAGRGYGAISQDD